PCTRRPPSGVRAASADRPCRTTRRTSARSQAGRRWCSLREVLRVDQRELLPLLGQLILCEARVHRARLDARVAVDALLRVDVELLDVVVVGLVGRRVNAVDRADLDAGVVLLPDARLGDD